MAIIGIEIEKCNKCPYVYTEPVLTGDSWDHMEDYICTQNNQKIAGCVEWPSEIPPVPDWCPIRIKQEELCSLKGKKNY